MFWRMIEGEKDIYFWSNADAESQLLCGFSIIFHLLIEKRFLIFDNCFSSLCCLFAVPLWIDIEMIFSVIRAFFCGGIHKRTQHSKVRGMEFSDWTFLWKKNYDGIYEAKSELWIGLTSLFSPRQKKGRSN